MPETEIKAGRIDPLLTKTMIQSLEIRCNFTDFVYIDAGVVGSDDGEEIMEVTATLSVDIDTNGANGLDTGSPADNTWYYVYVISNYTTVAGLLSTSASAPTMPSGYVKKKAVSKLRRGTGAFYFVRQYNDYVKYANRLNVLTNGSATSRTQISLSNYVPDEAYSADINWRFEPDGTNIQASRVGYVEALSGSAHQWCYMGIDETASTVYHYRQFCHIELPMYYTSPTRLYYYQSGSDADTSLWVQGYRLKGL